jgi:hypothetical protein
MGRVLAIFWRSGGWIAREGTRLLGICGDAAVSVDCIQPPVARRLALPSMDSRRASNACDRVAMVLDR